MIIRPTRADEAALAAAFPVDDPVGSVDADRYRGELGRGLLRPGWTWVAEDAGELVGRAVWWGRADSTHPLALDCLQVRDGVPDRVALAAELLAAGHAALVAPGGAPPAWTVSVPGDWRDRPAVVEAVRWRRGAARAAGLTEELERVQVAWTAGSRVPPPAGRLTFRPEPQDEVVLAAFRAVAVGSLDGETVRALAVLGPEVQAQDDLEFYRGCPGEREWWRLGYAPDGTLAAVAVPSATPYHRNVGYLGVVPGARGRGLVDDVLDEVTRVHLASGPVDRITATTDATNTPMLAAFARAGYHRTGTRLVLSAPAPG